MGKYVMLVAGPEKRRFALFSAMFGNRAIVHVTLGKSYVYRCDLSVYEVEADFWSYFRFLVERFGCVVLSSMWQQ